MSKEPLISVFIVCLNEETKIRRALESVKWCDEIVIIDSGSKDKTIEICKEYTQKIYHRAWTGYIEQKQFGLNNCSCEWVLNIDADEVVSETLQNEIKALVEKDSGLKIKENGFYISRVVFYLGRWWRSGGWYPEYRLRLSRRKSTTWGGTDPHEKAIVVGNTSRLKGELFHYTYTDISDQIARLNRYSASSALGLYQRGKRASLFSILGRPTARFIKFFILKRGYRDGLAGFIVAILESYYVFLKYAKLWELHHKS